MLRTIMEIWSFVVALHWREKKDWRTSLFGERKEKRKVNRRWRLCTHHTSTAALEITLRFRRTKFVLRLLRTHQQEVSPTYYADLSQGENIGQFIIPPWLLLLRTHITPVNTSGNIHVGRNQLYKYFSSASLTVFLENTLSEKHLSVLCSLRITDTDIEVLTA